MEVQIEKRNQSAGKKTVVRRLIRQPDDNQPADIELFTSLNDVGVQFLFVLRKVGQWAIQRDGKTVAGGEGNVLSIEAGVREYQLLTDPPDSPVRRAAQKGRRRVPC